MTRTSFLKKLLASLVIGKLPITETKKFRKIYLLQCFVAGFKFYEGIHLLKKMKEGELLELVREPNNEYDSCAIALHYQKQKIGFIPADINEMLSYLLDAEALSLFAVITHLEKTAKPWENVSVAIYFLQEENKKLPVHANYLTRIEAPHYRTLKYEKEKLKNNTTTLEVLINHTNRIIDLNKIPAHHQKAKKDLAKYYAKYRVEKIGNYVQVPNDGIYSYLYDLSEEVKIVKDKAGKVFYEFFLI